MFDVLKTLQREDPSFTVNYDNTTGQILLTGQGELHLEVIRDRLAIENKIETKLGNLRISYRESVKKNKELEYSINSEKEFIKLVVEIEPEEPEEQVSRDL